MKPIRIFTHAICEPPGYLVTLLDRLQYPYEHVCLNDGKTVPLDVAKISGMVFMGGPGDVNSPAEWMKQELELIRRANAQGLPMLGICLGAQLMSKALGGKVWQADYVEVGWHDVELLSSAKSHPWFVNMPEKFGVFQWHAHVFSPPPGAISVATSDCTQCQAYIMGSSLALQFHLEMSELTITELTEKYSNDLVGESDCVQNREQITSNITARCEQTFDIADALLVAWFHSLYNSTTMHKNV